MLLIIEKWIITRVTLTLKLSQVWAGLGIGSLWICELEFESIPPNGMLPWNLNRDERKNDQNPLLLQLFGFLLKYTFLGMFLFDSLLKDVSNKHIIKHMLYAMITFWMTARYRPWDPSRMNWISFILSHLHWTGFSARSSPYKNDLMA